MQAHDAMQADVKKRARLGERIGFDHAIAAGEIIGRRWPPIDVGSNAARMKLARGR